MFGISKVFHREPRAASDVLEPVRAAGWMKRVEAIMGTEIVVELWADDHAQGEEAIEAVIAEMHRIDRCMSPHKPDSELSRINRDAAARPVALSAEMMRLLTQAERFSNLSDGAFDITYAAVGQLYDYRRRISPNAAALARARELVGWRNLIIDEDAGTVRFALEGMRI
ncbi:MAG: FAD:protein FMN transferase, partial [Rhizobacter sp.]